MLALCLATLTALALIGGAQLLIVSAAIDNGWYDA